MTPPHDPGPTHGPGHVLEVKTGGYMVQSRTTSGVWYLVHARSCSCPAGQEQERCVHRQQVARFVAALDAEQKRPTASPAVGMLCD